MRLNNTTSRRRSISLTPLIDVVFLLLVFFMLASTFMKYASVPVAATGNGPGAAAPNLRNLALIHVGPGQTLSINGETKSIDDLKTELTRLQSRGVNQVVIALRPGTTVEDLTVTLSTVRRIPFKSIRVVR